MSSARLADISLMGRSSGSGQTCSYDREKQGSRASPFRQEPGILPSSGFGRNGNWIDVRGEMGVRG